MKHSTIAVSFWEKSTLYHLGLTKTEEKWEMACHCDEENLICRHCYKILTGDLSFLSYAEADKIREILPELRASVAAEISVFLRSPIEKIKMPRKKIKKTQERNIFCNALFNEDGTVEPPSNEIFTTPIPPIIFEGSCFCFTGVFAYGERKDCEEATAQKGAIIKKNITKSVDYLVVGSASNADWAYGNYGTKIEAALEKGIFIIPEDAWANAILSKA